MTLSSRAYELMILATHLSPDALDEPKETPPTETLSLEPRPTTASVVDASSCTKSSAASPASAKSKDSDEPGILDRQFEAEDMIIFVLHPSLG